MKKKYELRFLPLFEDDLNSIIDYISLKLKNPIAAENFVNDVEKAIAERLPFAESFEVYPSAFNHKYPYYYIQVHNYFIFYVVIGNVMEVRRIVYSRRNLDNKL